MTDELNPFLAGLTHPVGEPFKPTLPQKKLIESIDLDRPSTMEEASATLRPGPALGLKVGDQVRVTWSYSKAYGVGTAAHEGTIVELDDWLRCKPFSPRNGVLHLPLTMIDHLERIEAQT